MTKEDRIVIPKGLVFPFFHEVAIYTKIPFSYGIGRSLCLFYSCFGSSHVDLYGWEINAGDLPRDRG